MKYVVLLLFLIGFVGTVHAVTEFTPIQNISNTNHESLNSSVVTDGKTIFITWTEFTQGNQGSDILFSKSTDGGQTFSVPKNISNNQGSSIIPFIVTDGKTIFITWTYRYQDTHSEIFLSKSTDGGQTFSVPLKISKDSEYASGSELVIDNDNVFVTWFDIVYSSERNYENMEVYFSKSTDGGTTFSTPLNLSNNKGYSSHPSILNDNKTILIAWQDDSIVNTDIFFSKSVDNGTTFSTPLNLSNNPDGSVGADIATDGKNIFVTWFEFHKGNSDIFFSKSTDGGTTFSTPKNLSNDKEYSGVPFMLINRTDIFIAWTDSVIDGSWIVLSNSTDGGETFSTPQKISQEKGFSNAQSLSSDGKTLFATWSYHVLQESPYDVIFTKSKINESLTSVESPDKISLIDKSEPANNENRTGDSEDKITNYTTAKIEWNKHVAEIGDYGLLKITDPDMNVDPTRVDIFTAKAWSNTDPQGISLDMIESGINTSEFYIDVEFTTGNSGIQMLKIGDGDVVTALYHDNTIPEKLGTSMDLTDMINIITKHISPLQQLDQGTPIDKITCRDESFSLFVKDGSPLCLSESTHAKLVARGYFD